MPELIRGARRIGGRLSIELRCLRCGQVFTPTADAIRSGPSVYRYCESCRMPERDGEDLGVAVR